MTSTSTHQKVISITALCLSTSASMWAAGYITHLPGIGAPKWLTLVLMLAALFLGGLRTGRSTDFGWKGGLLLGAGTWLINLLVLGSLITGSVPGEIAPTAPVWLLGSLLLICFVAAIGSAVGTARRDSGGIGQDWFGALAQTAAATTLLLLVAGGLVTSEDAGMAVPDWPNSFGYNMFLFPLSRMTGGIFYEHAHRLFGSLTGLTVLVMAVAFHLGRAARHLRSGAWIALVLVCVQGALGGIRVTENSEWLALGHGVLGQLFFAYLVSIAALAAPWFKDLCAIKRPEGALGDSGFSRWVTGVLVLQLLLGCFVRHFHSLFHLHMTVGIVAAVLVIVLGVRAWGHYGVVSGGKPIRRAGLGLTHAASAQVLLGFAAWVSGVLTAQPQQATDLQVWLATAHQAVGALVLAWSFRLAVMHNRPQI